jgi:hypothetical protein
MRKLTKAATSLLGKVRGAGVNSYEVKKKEKKAAQELVDKEYCFFSMDRDHLGWYKYPETHDTASLDPPTEEDMALMASDTDGCTLDALEMELTTLTDDEYEGFLERGKI